jgi:hypothetical protein
MYKKLNNCPYCKIDLSLINNRLSCMNSEQLLDSFRKYILQFIQNYIDTHDFIIIDHTHTGKSANTFYDLLIGIGFNNKIYYINLLDHKTPVSRIVRPKLYYGYMMIGNKSLNLISGHKIPRAVPQYFFWEKNQLITLKYRKMQ